MLFLDDSRWMFFFFSRLLNWQLALGNAFTSAVWELVQASSCLGDIWSLKGWMNCKHWVLSWTFFFNMRLKDWNYYKNTCVCICMYICTIHQSISRYTPYFHQYIHAPKYGYLYTSKLHYFLLLQKEWPLLRWLFFYTMKNLWRKHVHGLRRGRPQVHFQDVQDEKKWKEKKGNPAIPKSGLFGSLEDGQWNIPRCYLFFFGGDGSGGVCMFIFWSPSVLHRTMWCANSSNIWISHCSPRCSSFQKLCHGWLD